MVRSRSARGGGASRSETLLLPLEKVISAADKPNVVHPKPRPLLGEREVIGRLLSPAPPPPRLLARTGPNQGVLLGCKHFLTRGFWAVAETGRQVARDPGGPRRGHLEGPPWGSL